MATSMKNAQELIFNGLGASNFKMFPGTNPYASSEAIAHEVSKAVEQIGAGEAEEFVID